MRRGFGTVLSMDSMEVEQKLRSAVRMLLDGGVVLVPTDTVYGLAVLPSAQDGVRRLFELKGRPVERNLPVMVPDPAALSMLGVRVSNAARAILASDLVPGPITIAFGFCDEGRPDWLAGRHEVAVRIPADDALLEILRRTGPLLVTSANFHGKPTGRTVQEIVPTLSGEPDFVFDGGPRETVPSTLVNCRLVPPVVEREGIVSFEQLTKIVECTK